MLPEDVLNAQMQRKGRSRYTPTKKELEKIQKAGLWIPKEEFSYSYALQVIEIGQLLEKKFIEKIKEYIISGRKLNVHKDFCQQWIIARKNINPDEDISLKMKKMIDKELKKYQ